MTYLARNTVNMHIFLSSLPLLLYMSSFPPIFVLVVHFFVLDFQYKMYKVCPDNFREIAKKNTVIVATFFVFGFCQYGHQRSSRISGSALITVEAPRWSSPPYYFSYPHLSSYRRPPEREWGRPARSSPLAASQTVRTLSQTVKESPHTFRIARSSSPRKTIFFTHLADFFESFAILMRAA